MNTLLSLRAQQTEMNPTDQEDTDQKSDGDDENSTSANDEETNEEEADNDQEIDEGHEVTNNIAPNQAKRSLRVACWNMQGDLASKIRDKHWCSEITSHADIIFLLETWMLKGVELAITPPEGYVIHYASRPDSKDMRKQGGGVACLIRDNIEHNKNEILSSPDILVINLSDIRLIGSYILPYTSYYGDWSTIDPEERMYEIISASAAVPRALLWLGDLNARTASKNTSETWPRLSSDKVSPSARGRRLLDHCTAEELVILNGTAKEASSPGSFTSHQPTGSSVIDYAIANDEATELVTSLMVSKEPGYLSDHSVITVEIQIMQNSPPPLPSIIHRPKHKKPRTTNPPQNKIVIPAPVDPLTRRPVPPSVLDIMLQDAVLKKRSEVELCMELYGEYCNDEGGCINVWTSGVCGSPQSQRITASAGVYWSHDDPRNTSERTSGKQTKERAELLAVGIAILKADGAKWLRIFSDSQYAARTLCHWAGKQAEMGWKCKNSDIIKWIVKCIKARRCGIYVECSNDHEKVQGNIQARELAMKGLTKKWNQDIRSPPIPHYWKDLNPGTLSTGKTNKVSTKVPLMPTPDILPSIDPPPALSTMQSTHKNPHVSHRGRREWSERTIKNRRELLNSDPKKFYELIREYTSPKPKPIILDAKTLGNDFCKRLNPPETPPAHFDQDWMQKAKDIAGAMPERTTDRTIEKWFSRPITADEATLAKEKAKRHTAGAPGYDKATYQIFIDMPTNVICDLFNECLQSLDAPKAWLTAVLIAIHKEGRDQKKAESYRCID